MNRITGITDEAGKSIDTQIRVAKELGWSHIEVRGVALPDGSGGSSGGMIHDISDEEFEIVAQKLSDADVKVACFGSAIANWGKSVAEPFDSSLGEARRCIPRMKALGTKYVRIMSFNLLKDAAGVVLPVSEQLLDERVRRLRVLTDMFGEAGLQVVHENCMNYGGMGWTMTMELVEGVPGLKLLYDTGNPIFTPDYTQPAPPESPEPRPMQNALDFFRHVRKHVEYVHIKDGVWDAEAQKPTYCWPGEGDGYVSEILEQLHSDAYEGFISIEPHMAAIFHEPNQPPAEAQFETFVEYGRRMAELVKKSESQD